jgi:hypothetical protein
MFSAYVAHDYFQELVFTYSSFKYGWFMSLVEVSLMALAGCLQQRFFSQQPLPLVPSVTEAKCAGALALFIAVAQGAGSASLAHVSFPVKVVMKSSKLLPTMLIRSLFMNATYSVIQGISALGVCLGCAMFALADDGGSGSSRHASAIGIALLSVAVAADGCTASAQETLLTRYDIPPSRMVSQPSKPHQARPHIGLIFACRPGSAQQRVECRDAVAHVLGQRRVACCQRLHRCGACDSAAAIVDGTVWMHRAAALLDDCG